MKIGLIGSGAIGAHLLKSLPEIEFFVFDMDLNKAKKTIQTLALKNARIVGSFSDLRKEKPELVVEAASQRAVPHAVAFLDSCDVLVMSVGAFTDEALLKKAKKTAEKSGHTLFLPSGAIGGLDVLSACHPGKVELETRKIPKSLGRNDTNETIVFEGPAREACRLFPKNVNVAATLAIAGIGFDKTVVRIVSDPKADKNNHTVTIHAKTGNYRFMFENEPFEENPKTSALAAASAVALIRNLKASVQVG